MCNKYIYCIFDKQFKTSKMKVESVSIKRAGYGQYNLTGVVNDVEVSVHTTDSTIFDWLEDDENDENEEKHKIAIQDAKILLTNSFKRNNF